MKVVVTQDGTAVIVSPGMSIAVEDRRHDGREYELRLWEPGAGNGLPCPTWCRTWVVARYNTLSEAEAAWEQLIAWLVQPPMVPTGGLGDDTCRETWMIRYDRPARQEESKQDNTGTARGTGHKTVTELEEMVNLQVRYTKDLEQILEAIPACGAHGRHCIPHALEWIAEAKRVMGSSARPKTR